ncbi:MAG: hypothetical protein L0H79_20235 [Intrasporangium sp.]|uniref:hypothetical protein n=1 Tax=Intrasporangium sp. TaxID=1925024 RepID=UPI002648AEC3|nr:hypothetical protein [Intrasporangium sp.]MDN5798054.1 hypothetical protein [Intrasporangium sp.]
MRAFSGARLEPRRDDRGPDRRRPSSPRQAAELRDLRSLQQLAGNRTVTGLVGSLAVQRYPVPSAEQLVKDTGYKGGKFNKGSWAALLVQLGGYKQNGDNNTLTAIRQASRKARETFSADKKKKKVGNATAATIVTALTRLEVDCQIDVLRHQVTQVTQQLVQLTDPLAVSGLHSKVDQIQQLITQSTDDGTLGGWLGGIRGQIDGVFRKQWPASLAGLLNQHSHYHPDRTFLVADGPEFTYPLPHVAWKAHLGASRQTAFQVLAAALPVLKALGVQHKVDTDPDVFTKTNKFVTIYPPRDEALWPKLIAVLDVVPGTVQVAGELPVGRSGAVGMRHGQITGLDQAVLAQYKLSLVLEGKKVAGYSCCSIIDDRSKKPLTLVPAPWDASLPTFLTLHSRVVHVVQHVKASGKDKVAPAILHEGVIRPDPRQEPNPFKVDLPEGVTAKQ